MARNSLSSHLLQQAQAHYSAKEYDSATRDFQQLLAISPDCIDAMIGLAKTLNANNCISKSNQILSAYIHSYPHVEEFYYLLGKNFMVTHHYEMAAIQFYKILTKTEKFPDIVQRFHFCISKLRFLLPIDLSEHLCRLVRSGKNFDQSTASIVAKQIKHNCNIVSNNPITYENKSCLASQPLFHLYLQHFFNIDPDLENYIAVLRHQILIEAKKSKACSQEEYKLALCLASQALQNNYILAGESYVENDLGEIYRLSLSESINQGNRKQLITVYAMFSPPTLQQRAVLQSSSPNSNEEKNFIKLLDIDVSALKAIKVNRLFPSSNETKDVQDQYENFPFPRWTSIIASNKKRTLLESISHNNPTPIGTTIPDHTDILIAGCGTGQHALSIAFQYHYRSITAIDLSATSVAFAQTMMKSFHGFGAAIDFFQADILALLNWEKRFHHIEAVGVIHHTPDPLETWKILKNLLHPQGWMKIGLYSRKARGFIHHAKQVVESLNLDSSEAHMRAFRRFVKDATNDITLQKLLTCSDFFNMNHLRDLIFHSCEHTFDIAEIESMMRHLGLEFMGFSFDQPEVMAKYRELYPDDPYGLKIANWEGFEDMFPDTFKEMYRFWCRIK